MSTPTTLTTQRNTHNNITQCRDAQAWIREQIEFAAYAGIPIGNVIGDYPMLIADLMYSRSLRSQNMLLWNSRTTQPDLGGTEEDDNFFAAVTLMSEMEHPEICAPNGHDDVVIELDVAGLGNLPFSFFSSPFN